MVKLGFLLPGSYSMMPHIVQGAINIPIIHVVDFGNFGESYNCKSKYEKIYFLKYKHLF